MGLILNGTDQYLKTSWAPGVAQPMSFMAWIYRDTVNTEDTVISAGDIDNTLTFNSLQCKYSDNTRAISFIPYAEADGSLVAVSTLAFVCAVFNGTSLNIYVNNETVVSTSWTGSSTAIDTLQIGATVASTLAGFFDGTIEHAAIFNIALTGTQVGELYTLTTAPNDISGCIAYLPLKDSLTDEIGNFTWSAEGITTPSYTDLGISYGPATYSITYNGNGNTSGTVPIDSTEYDLNDTVIVLENTGNLVKTNHNFLGWNTTSDGSGTDYDPSDTFNISTNITLYAQWEAIYQNRTINYTNYNSDTLNATKIALASELKVYFEHASVGWDIVGNSDTDSTAGLNHDSSGDCGLKLLYTANNRYPCDRDTQASGNDYTWFSTHTGLQSNYRGNPTPAVKLSGFAALSANMGAAIDIAMFKFCYIDVWSSTSGYITDGEAFAASVISVIETLESSYPNITFVYWTMPVEYNVGYEQRDLYNAYIRNYCLEQGKYLFDIASIESHDDEGIAYTTGGYESAYTGYMEADGGHLASAGRLKAAKAYWSLLGAMIQVSGTGGNIQKATSIILGLDDF